MNQLTKVFNYQNKEVRTVTKDGEPWFVAKDVCEILEIQNVTQAVQKLDEDERAMFNIGRQGETNIVNEPGLYSLILSSRKQEAKQFKRWITHEVIPSIRKHGMYATDDLLNDPDLAIKAFTALKEEREQRKLLEAKVEEKDKKIIELQPKASYYDLILQTKSTFPISQISKDYGMSANKFNQTLKELKVQYKQGKSWLLYQKYANEGYTSSKTFNYFHKNGDQGSSLHTQWTQKGRLFIYELLKSELNILPVIERNVATQSDLSATN